MSLSSQIAGQFEEVHLNGKWVVATNLKEQLSDVTWEQATTKIGNINTIAALAYHINYYVAGVVDVFEGGPLSIRDKFSFDCPPIQSKKEWDDLLKKIWRDAERFAKLVSEIPEKKLGEVFVDEKYGNIQRNIHAIIEHCYYHLGQIVLIKKLLSDTGQNSK